MATFQTNSLSCCIAIRTGRNRWITSALVLVCSEGLVVRNEPLPAKAIGSNN